MAASSAVQATNDSALKATARHTTAPEEIKLAYLQRSLGKGKDRCDPLKESGGVDHRVDFETIEEQLTPPQKLYLIPVSAAGELRSREPRLRSVSSSAQLTGTDTPATREGNSSRGLLPARIFL